jgi:hypothetical protein
MHIESLYLGTSILYNGPILAPLLVRALTGYFRPLRDRRISFLIFLIVTVRHCAPLFYVIYPLYDSCFTM